MLSFFLRMFEKLGSWIAGGSLASAGVELAKWASWKLLLAAFWFTGVYILCNNLLVFLAKFAMDNMSPAFSVNPHTGTSLAMQLTGLGAYIAQEMMLIDAVSALVSGLSLAFVRQFLPWPIGR